MGLVVMPGIRYWLVCVLPSLIVVPSVGVDVDVGGFVVVVGIVSWLNLNITYYFPC